MLADDIQLRRDVERATRAQALIDDDVLKEVFDSFDADSIAVWRATEASDVAKREQLWLTAKVAAAIRGKLLTIISDGTIAAAEIAEIEKRRPSEANSGA